MKTIFRPSKISLGTTLRLGFSGVFLHPIRLLLTMLLPFLTFTLFSVSLHMMFYDVEAAKITTFAEFTQDFELYKSGSYTVEEADGLLKKLGLPYAYVQYKSSYFDLEISARGGDLDAAAREELYLALNKYMRSRLIHVSSVINGFVTMDKELFSHYELTFTGRMPAERDEITVPSCLANAFCAVGLYDGERVLTVSEPAELMGKKIMYAGEWLEIVGIYQNTLCDKQFTGAEILANCRGQFGEAGLFSGCVFVNHERFGELLGGNGFRTMLLCSDGTTESGRVMWEFLNGTEEYSASIYAPIYAAQDKVEYVYGIFFVLAIVLSFFTLLLLYQLIDISIDDKRSMIGILRALGCQPKQVSIILLIENIALGVIVGGARLWCECRASPDSEPDLHGGAQTESGSLLAERTRVDSHVLVEPSDCGGVHGVAAIA